MVCRLALLALGLALAACSIDRNVAPVAPARIELLCIEQNANVLMADFEPTLKRLIEARGIPTRLYSGAQPPECRHVARYVANWRWDLAMYLYYVRIEVFEDHKSIGSAEYDATLGGLNLDKFGSTESKLAPLVSQLFPT